jgi:TP901-1 family phage major tail protein
MPANYQLGKDGALYYSTTALTSVNSSTANGTAILIDNVQDVSTNLTKDTVEINSRAGGGWKAKVGTLKDATVTMKVLWKPGDTAFAALRDAYLNNTEVAFWVLDQVKATTGAQGVAGNFNVTNFSRAEPIGDVMTADVELAPSSFTHWFIKGTTT